MRQGLPPAQRSCASWSDHHGGAVRESNHYEHRSDLRFRQNVVPSCAIIQFVKHVSRIFQVALERSNIAF